MQVLSRKVLKQLVKYWLFVYLVTYQSLPAFLQKFFQKMLHNGYMYPKGIFLVTYFVLTSVNGWFKLIFGGEIFWIWEFCVISLLYVIVVNLQTHTGFYLLQMGAENFSPSQKQWQHQHPFFKVVIVTLKTSNFKVTKLDDGLISSPNRKTNFRGSAQGQNGFEQCPGPCLQISIPKKIMGCREEYLAKKMFSSTSMRNAVPFTKPIQGWGTGIDSVWGRRKTPRRTVTDRTT